jgi:membrane protease YdiL (CAAX protease family)
VTEDGAPIARTWPADRPLADDEAIAVACGACALPWRVHTSLAGFRLRCDCGAWLDVPPSPTPEPALPAPANAPPTMPHRLHLARRRRDERGLVPTIGDDDLMQFAPVPLDAPMAPGSLRNQSPSNRARWTNRTLLEFGALLAALLGPQLAALLLARGGEFELLLPFTTLVSGVLVAIVVAASGPYGRLGLHRGPWRHYATALLGAGVALLAAIGWLWLLGVDEPGLVSRLRAELGLPLTLFVVATAPAVLEEVMFRGVLQGRLLALLGRRAGLLTTAMAFALCHGAPAVLPIHFAGGLGLGWLRERTGTLLPGMFAHFVYNGAIVVFAIG